jgi:hypothetical protein
MSRSSRFTSTRASVQGRCRPTSIASRRLARVRARSPPGRQTPQVPRQARQTGAPRGLDVRRAAKRADSRLRRGARRAHPDVPGPGSAEDARDEAHAPGSATSAHREPHAPGSATSAHREPYAPGGATNAHPARAAIGHPLDATRGEIT